MGHFRMHAPRGTALPPAHIIAGDKGVVVAPLAFRDRCSTRPDSIGLLGDSWRTRSPDACRLSLLLRLDAPITDRQNAARA